jgi:hypothetical protein
MPDMDDVHHHQRCLRNEFGDLSPNLMVAFRGNYNPKVGPRIQMSDVQVFHHLCCHMLTGKDGQENTSTERSLINYSYRRGTHLLQIQVARQFDLRMCERCAKLFTKGQQDHWSRHTPL